jgi:hypothetical protein
MSILQTPENISLFIPYVNASCTKEEIIDIFENREKIGKIKCVDMVAKLNPHNKQFNAVYVHFEHWNTNKNALDFHSKVLNSETEARMTYKNSLYWIVVKNTSKKVNPGERKIRINLNEVPFPTTPSPVVEVKIPDKPTKQKQKTNNYNLYQVSAMETNIKKKLTFEKEKQEKKEKYIVKKNIEPQKNKENNEEFEVSTMDDILSDPKTDHYVIEFIEHIENELDELDEESHLVTVDERYIKTMEAENQYLINLLYSWEQYYRGLRETSA